VFLPPEIAFYLFNHKRERISAIEARYDMKVVFSSDAALTGTNFRIEKVRAQTAAPAATAPASYGPVTPQRSQPIAEDTDETEDDEATGEGEDESADAPVATDTAEEGERKRRRRRRRGKRREGGESRHRPSNRLNSTPRWRPNSARAARQRLRRQASRPRGAAAPAGAAAAAARARRAKPHHRG
jgi:hypothetical protein